MMLPYGPEYALELIRENARTKDPFLDLGNCRLTELPEELGELTHLKGLNLASVYFNDEGEGITIPRHPQKILLDLFSSYTKELTQRINFPAVELLLMNKMDLLDDFFSDCAIIVNKITDFEILRKLINLEFLVFENEDSDLFFLSYLVELKTLTIIGDHIDFNNFNSLRKLESLFIFGEEVSNICFLQNFTKLKKLIIPEINDANPLTALTDLQILFTYEDSDEYLEKSTQLNSLFLHNLSSIKYFRHSGALKTLIIDREISDSSYLKGMENLQVLISLGGISDIGFLQHLTNLQILIVIGEVSDVIFLQHLTNLQILILGEEVSDTVFLQHLTNLQILILGGEVSHTSFLKHLTNLQILMIGNDFFDVKNLQYLLKLQVLVVGKELLNANFLEYLVDLQTLVIESELRDASFLRFLPKLHTVMITSEVLEISSLNNLPRLKNLILAVSPNEEFFQEQIYLEILVLKKITSPTSLKNLTRLKFLAIEEEIPEVRFLENLTQLESLRIESKSSNISVLENLVNLNYLDLSYSEIIDVRILNKLEKLVCLNIRKNPIREIPYEIFNQKNCLLDLRSWIYNLEQGSVHNYETKLIICGNGRVGKTCIIKRLLNENEYSDQASTQGIELGHWNLPLEGEAHGDQELLINIWDFGGQEIYHSTHRLFMRSRALYIIVWDWESEQPGSTWSEEIDGQTYTYRNHTLSYWLDHIRTFSQDSPVIIVQNKIDAHGRMRPSYQEALDKMYDIADYRSVSAKTGAGFTGLKELIQEVYQEKMPEIGMDMPASWDKVRKALRDLAKTETDISYEQYEIICEDNSVNGVSCKSLIRYLHQGGMLYYQEGIFLDRIILDQKWALAAIYTIFNRTKPFYRIKKGKDATFCLSDLEVALMDTDYPLEKREVILSFMRSCEVCLFTGEWHENGEPLYLAPELLPDHKPSIVTEYWEPYRSEAIHFISKHAILHRAFIQRFILRAARLTNSMKHIWRDGILFHYQSNYALVEARQEDKGGVIYIQVSGKDKDVLLRLILNELRSIYYYDHKFKLPYLISANGLDFVDLEDLQKEIKAGNTHVTAQNGNLVQVESLKIFMPREKEKPLGGTDIDILKPERKLSDVIPKDDEPTPRENKKLKVFISYAHEDDQWRFKLRNAILALELSSNHPIEVFDDVSLRAGKDINEGLLKEQLEKSQIVIFLVSPDFLRSKFCREQEVPLALEQREKGKTQILPVVIEALPGYHTLPFGHIASTPKRLQSIKGSQDEREAWHEVYQDLEAMIKEHYSKK